MSKTVKNVVILGSTGTIGLNTLKVVARYPNRFRVVALSAYNNVRLLESQVRRFSPTHVAVTKEKIPTLKKSLGSRRVKVLSVESDLSQSCRSA